MTLRKLYSLLILLIISLAIVPQALFAESKAIYNLNVEFSSLTAIDQEQVKIEMSGEEAIIPKDELNYYLVSQYFKQNKYGADFKTLQQLYGQSLAKKDYKIATLALTLAAKDKTHTATRAMGFFENSSDALFKFIKKQEASLGKTLIDRSSSLGVLYVYLAREQYPQVYLSSCCSQEKQLELAELLVVETLLEKPEEVTDLTDYFKLSLNSNSKFARLTDFVTSYVHFRSGPAEFVGNYDRIRSLFPDYWKEFQSMVAEDQARLLGASIKTRQHRQAFELLQLTPFEKRTENTHEQLIKIIKVLDVNSMAIFLLDPFRHYLQKFAQKDQRINSLIVSRHEEVIRTLLESDQAFQATDFLHSLYFYRPNPNPKNTELLFSQIQTFDRLNLSSQAAVASQAPVSYNFSQRLWFFKKGYYINLWLLALMILASLAIMSFFFFKEDLIKKFLKTGVAQSPEHQREWNAGANTVNQFKQLNPNWQKYETLLGVFGLTVEASADEIKSAYRKTIKAFHPDINPNQTDKDKDTFLELTEKYEEVLKLHERLVLKKSNAPTS